MRHLIHVLCVTLALGAAPAAAVTCSFVSAGPVTFGAYDVYAGSPLDTTGSVVFVCTGVGGGDTVTVDLSAGGSGTFTARTLSGGADQLSYNLYLDAARTQVWGDGSGATSHYGPATPPDGTNVTLTVYGRVPAGQSVPAGTYTDTVVATVNF